MHVRDRNDLLGSLPRLVAYLRKNGYALGVADGLRLQALLEELLQRGDIPLEHDALARCLGPVVCRTPEQQARLPQVLRTWFTLGRLAGAPTYVSSGEKNAATEKTLLLWKILLAILAVVALIVAAFSLPLGPANDGTTTDNESTWSIPIGGWFAVGIAAIGLAFAAFQRFRRPPNAVLTRSSGAMSLDQHLALAVREEVAYSGRDLEVAAGQLRRHSQRASNLIDVGRTVAATVRSAGFVRLVSRRRAVRPEYLVLSSRASSNDQLNHLAGVLAQRLRAGLVDVRLGEYFGDPREVLIRQGDVVARYSLRQLAVQRPNLRLLMVADASTFRDPQRNQWREWVADLKHFQKLVLLTPELEGVASDHSNALRDCGFLIAPATSEGGSIAFGVEAPPCLSVVQRAA